MKIIDCNSDRIIDNRNHISNKVNRIIILSENDLLRIDSILCGQDLDIVIVPRVLTDKEKKYVNICLLNSSIKRIITL